MISTNDSSSTEVEPRKGGGWFTGEADPTLWPYNSSVPATGRRPFPLNMTSISTLRSCNHKSFCSYLLYNYTRSLLDMGSVMSKNKHKVPLSSIQLKYLLQLREEFCRELAVDFYHFLAPVQRG